MNDDMFRPSCGHHQVLQLEIQYHKMITHLPIREYTVIFTHSLPTDIASLPLKLTENSLCKCCVFNSRETAIMIFSEVTPCCCVSFSCPPHFRSVTSQMTGILAVHPLNEFLLCSTTNYTSPTELKWSVCGMNSDWSNINKLYANCNSFWECYVTHTVTVYQLLFALTTHNSGPQACVKYVMHFIGFYRRAS